MPWDINAHTLLILEHGQNVLLCFLNGSAGSLEFDLGAPRALPRNIKSDVELRLNASARITPTTNEETVLYWGNLNVDGNLILTLLDKQFDSSNDLVYNFSISFQSNCSVFAFSARKSDKSRRT